MLLLSAITTSMLDTIHLVPNAGRRVRTFCPPAPIQISLGLSFLPKCVATETTAAGTGARAVNGASRQEEDFSVVARCSSLVVHHEAAVEGSRAGILAGVEGTSSTTRI